MPSITVPTHGQTFDGNHQGNGIYTIANGGTIVDYAHAADDLWYAIENNNIAISELSDLVQDTFNAGYDDGYTDGYKDGFKDGWDARQAAD